MLQAHRDTIVAYCALLGPLSRQSKPLRNYRQVPLSQIVENATSVDEPITAILKWQSVDAGERSVGLSIDGAPVVLDYLSARWFDRIVSPIECHATNSISCSSSMCEMSSHVHSTMFPMDDTIVNSNTER